MLSVRFSCLYLLLVRQILPIVEMKFEFFPSAHSKLEISVSMNSMKHPHMSPLLSSCSALLS